jgi:hypothetical protein
LDALAERDQGQANRLGVSRHSLVDH